MTATELEQKLRDARTVIRSLCATVHQSRLDAVLGEDHPDRTGKERTERALRETLDVAENLLDGTWDLADSEDPYLLCPTEVRALMAADGGADILDAAIAVTLRRLRAANPELVLITRVMGEYGTGEPRPYFGAMLTPAGREAAKRAERLADQRDPDEPSEP